MNVSAWKDKSTHQCRHLIRLFKRTSHLEKNTLFQNSKFDRQDNTTGHSSCLTEHKRTFTPRTRANLVERIGSSTSGPFCYSTNSPAGGGGHYTFVMS